MRIQVLSDLHLEVCKNPEKLLSKILPPFPRKDTILVLAGDIGHMGSDIYMKCIEKCAELYDAVFVVSGNHEYYHSSIETVNNLVKTIIWPNNVYYLDKTSVIYKQVRFLGCILWGQADTKTAYQVNDFNYIRDMSVDMYNNMHSTDLSWLENRLADPESTEYSRTIVVTHHMPSQLLVHGTYKNHPLNSYYSNDLDDLVRKADMWFCGHTHIAVQRHIGKCWCVINPVGYSGEYTKCNTREFFSVS